MFNSLEENVLFMSLWCTRGEVKKIRKKEELKHGNIIEI